MIDRYQFYEKVRPLFGGTISQSQVNGINTILDQWGARHGETGDLRWLAYMLATTKWETAHTMEPVEEYGHGAGRPYGAPDQATGKAYYGRGLVQLTWKDNYRKMGQRMGLDLMHFPEMALDPKIACDIMFDGMENGLFTGVGLPLYFNADVEDWVNARRIINGLDQADAIAALGRGFYAALS